MAKGATATTALTRKGYKTLAPAWSPDGTRIAYLEANGDEFPGIYVMHADGTNGRKLVENVFPTSAGGMTLAWSADSSRLYYTKIEVRGTNYYNDLYSYDLNKAGGASADQKAAGARSSSFAGREAAGVRHEPARHDPACAARPLR